MNDWDNITKQELQELYTKLTDKQIAEFFNVTVGKVRYKRNKYHITLKTNAYNEFLDQNSELSQKLNTASKDRLIAADLDVIAKALTHYIFRNGPIEDMHANNQLSQNDMKTLNKFMVNKLSGLIFKMRNNEWIQIELLFERLKSYGTHWDKAVPDTDDFESSWKEFQDSIHDKLF